ncbi:MAG: hypothetical protein ACT4OZ_08620 [Gemmatimonadota bacterium]
MTGGLAFAGRISAGRWIAVITFALAAPWPRASRAQEGNTAEAALNRALDLEGANKCREAIPLYRQAINVEDPAGAILGLERCYHAIGRPDSLLPLIDSILTRRPADPSLRGVQMRTLAAMHADQRLSAAFEAWATAVPAEPAPYRTYARILLEQGRALTADSVLGTAVGRLGAGGGRALSSEFAQMQAALGLWTRSAASWREASEQMPYLEQAAVFSLFAVPADVRDSVRTILASEPVTLGARRVLAGLELRWNAPRAAWSFLSQVPAGDSAVEAWIEFARAAEDAETWLTARDAWAHIARHRASDPAHMIRAASASMSGGEAASAIAILDSARNIPAAQFTNVLVLRIRALSIVGRPAEIEKLIDTQRAALDDPAMRNAQRALAWGWIRAGNLGKAKKALEAAGGGTEDDDRVAAWIALYEGDLASARRGLRRTDETSGEVVTAMALLSRTTAIRSTTVGDAFLLLSRRDSMAASRKFVEAAGELTDARPLLLGAAARYFAAAGDTTRAVEIWGTLISDHPESPEAAESDLEWARVLRQRGDSAGSIARLEHLILTYPRSALVPQARRELDIVRGRTPPE